jgi:hypothetical protein
VLTIAFEYIKFHFLKNLKGSTAVMFKEKVIYEPGDLEFYQKMWRIDPDAAKTWIVNRLNTLTEISEYIKNEIKQLRDMTNYKEDKKALDYYHATGGDGRRKSYCHKNREIIIDYMRQNLDVAVRTKDIINKFLSLGMKGVNVYNLVTEMVDQGSVVRAGHGYLKLPESRTAVEL